MALTDHDPGVLVSSNRVTAGQTGCASQSSGPAIVTLQGANGQDACKATVLPPNDDSSTGLVPLGFSPSFFGQTYTSVYVNNNGNVTFDGPQYIYTPYPLQGTNHVIIAPYFSDVDTRSGGQPVTYSYGGGTYAGHRAFCVDWINVGYYDQHYDKLNSFQLVLIDRADVGAGNFDIMMNYNQIQWEAGDASGGVGGLGGTSARVGYSNGVNTSFELPGSGVNGSFLDSNPSGLIHGSRGSLIPGQYIYPVRNGTAPAGGTISGTVKFNSASGTGIPGAPVQACASNGFCQVTRTSSVGTFTFSALADGAYTITALAPVASTYTAGSAGPITISGGNSVSGVIIVETGPQGLPPGTAITNVGTYGNGIPIVYWQTPLTLTTTGCAGGSAAYQLSVSGSTVRSGSMTEGPSGTYTATLAPLYPTHGNAHIAITITCPGQPAQTRAFDLYIDPSGTVLDQHGNAVSGATVTLYQQDFSGNWAQVPDGSDIMSPVNRSNPDMTDSAGHFGWDVLAGTYKIRAEKAGCVSPGDPTQPYVESAPLMVPPAITGLTLTLNCSDTAPPTTTASGMAGNDSYSFGTWTDQDVQVTLTATDNPGGSGVAATFYAVDDTTCGPSSEGSCSTYGGAITISAEGQHTLTYFSVDNAGNAEAANGVAVWLDKTPPTITCGQPDGQWHAGDVSLFCTAADGGSGLAESMDAVFTLSTGVPAATETANAATDSHTVCDIAGNCATAGPIGGNKVDKKAPDIVVTVPSATSYVLGQVVDAAYTCTDGGSGVAACAGPVASGSPIDTSSAGTKSFAVDAADQVGNPSSQTVTFSVTYGICLLYDPTKVHHSGSTVPIKLEVCDAAGNDVSSAALTVHATGITPGVLQSSGNANPGNNFRYDSGFGGTGGYIFNLSTGGLTSGTYTLSFTVTGDPVTHTVQIIMG